MAFNRQGLKRVVKTVRTKRGVKRQVFWVKANPDAPKKPGLLRRAAGVAGKGLLGAAALGVAAYGIHKGAKYVHSGKAGEHAALLTRTARQLGDEGGRQFLKSRAAHHANAAAGHIAGAGDRAGAALHGLAGRAGKHADSFVNRLHNAARPGSKLHSGEGHFGGSRWGSGGEAKPNRALDHLKRAGEAASRAGRGVANFGRGFVGGVSHAARGANNARMGR